MEEYSKVLVVKADNVGSNQMQQIRKALREDNSVILMGKNTLKKKALSDCVTLNHHSNVQNLIDVIKGNVGLVFIKGDLKVVKDKLEKLKVGALARVGAVSPVDVVIPPGSTGLEPSNTSFFQALNIQTKISKGAVEIIRQVDLIKKGEKVGNSEATLLAKLNIKPFRYGLVVHKVYENGSVYDPEILDFTDDYLSHRLCMALANVSALALSLPITYPAISVLPHLILNGYKNLLSIALETNYSFPLADRVKAYLYLESVAELKGKDKKMVQEKSAKEEGESSSMESSSEAQHISQQPYLMKPAGIAAVPVVTGASTGLDAITMDEQQLSEAQDIPIQGTTPHDEGGERANHILARRMFEVFCISIHYMPRLITTYPTSYKIESLKDGIPCRIYGLVRVFSEDGQVYDIYNRKEVNSEIVPLDDFLSITSSHVISPTYLKVVVYLYDMAHDVEIANGVFDLDYRHENDFYYDVPSSELVNGQHGYAAIHYSTFQHAVVANVENVVISQVGGANSGVLRTVTARIERTYKDNFPSWRDDPSEQFLPSILFQNKQGSDPFHFGVPVKLFRTSIVVPPFCYLVISFSDNDGRKVVEDITFQVRDGGSMIQKSSQGQYCKLEMDVKWTHGYASQRTQPFCISDYFSLPRVLSDKQSYSSNISSAIPKAFPCVEIFSVIIWINKVEADINGTVEITDSTRGPFCIFQGDEKWFPKTALPIIGPPCSFDNQPFKFQIQIQDDEKRCVSKGSFEWNWDDYDDDDVPMSFYDKPLCSVIQGEVGYAAVHYAIITCGIQARISVIVRRCDNGPEFSAQVYGKISAEYSGHKYPTLYDKEYYKSTLFSKPKTEGVVIKVGYNAFNELPLAKSVMSVPLDELLVLDVDLVLVCLVKDADKNVKDWDEKSVHVKERWECLTNKDISYVIRLKDYNIFVDVSWSDERE